jgi:YD repeat-containing protein
LSKGGDKLKLKIRIIALVTFFTFFVTTMPAYAFAKTLNNKSSSNVNISSRSKESGAIVGERVDKRQRNVKHFYMDNGTYVAMVYNQPVHYYDGSEWKDIDNTLEEKDDAKGLINSKEDLLKDKTSFEVTEQENVIDNNQSGIDEIQVSNKILENKSNDFKVSIAKNLNADKLVTIRKDKYEISWNVKSERKVQVNKKELTEEDIDKISGVSDIKSDTNATEKQKIKAENIKKATASKITSEVEFKDIKPNVDLQYKLISNNLKESIIINSNIEVSNFSFNLNTKNLKPILKNNQVSLIDNENNKEIFIINAPLMIDAKGEKSNNIKMGLNKKGNGYILSLNLDKNWLMDKDRAYPVIIDPSMQTSVAQQDIKETFVCSNDSSDKSNNQYLRVGNTPSVGITRSYMKFVNLPKLNTGDMITSAQLYLLKEPSASGTDGQVDVHRVTSDWNAYGLNWSNQPSTDPKIEDYQELNNGSWYIWDISSLVKGWYNSGTNYGIMLRATDEGSGYTAYWSSDISDVYAYARPVVNFYYVNNSGLESYWTYHSQDVGRAGTSYVNDYNGNLIHIHNDMSMSGNRMPVTINHIYNSNDRDSDIGYGLGWRLNFSQKVTYQNIGEVGYYQYIDEDGTQKYFKNDSSVMKEENGSDLTLTKNSDSSFTLKDKKDNKLNFDSSGTLTNIVDNNNNTITLNYVGSKLISLKDGVNRTTTLIYNEQGKLSEIIEPIGAKTTYTYTGNQLTGINYVDGKSSTYAYDGSNKLLSAANHAGYKISYEYYTMAPYRVSKIKESNVDGTNGNQLTISYGFNTTTFTDVKNKSEVFSFNNSGQTTGIKDAEGNGKYFKYESVDRL